MPSEIKPIAVAFLAMLAAACSSTPATPAPRTAEPTLAAIAPGTASAAPAASASAVDASLVKAGYSVMRRHDEILYCRNEVITGQRIGTRICLTAAQIQSEKQNVTKAKDLLNQPAYRCLGAPCNN
jgi:hypothetical protein